MQARIDRYGNLIIESMNEQEDWMLIQWSKESIELSDGGFAFIPAHRIEIRMEDEQ